MSDLTAPLGCEVAVVGAGPAGLAAAVVAAEAGRRVVVVDEGFTPGGQIWRRDVRHAPTASARSWQDRLAASGAATLSATSIVSIRAQANMGGMVLTGEC